MKTIIYIIALATMTGGFMNDASAKPWDKKLSPEEIKKKLTPEEYRISQEDGTERAFHNKYWDHHEEGIYVDAVNGKPLFSSLDKYDSGSGWPSFTKPIDQAAIVTKLDLTYGQRTEVRSNGANQSHLGHVFDDGPQDKGGKRFCMNSGSLRFVAKKDLEKEGYGEYSKLFEQPKK